MDTHEEPHHGNTEAHEEFHGHNGSYTAQPDSEKKKKPSTAKKAYVYAKKIGLVDKFTKIVKKKMGMSDGKDSKEGEDGKPAKEKGVAALLIDGFKNGIKPEGKKTEEQGVKEVKPEGATEGAK